MRKLNQTNKTSNTSNEGSIKMDKLEQVKSEIDLLVTKSDEVETDIEKTKEEIISLEKEKEGKLRDLAENYNGESNLKPVEEKTIFELKQKIKDMETIKDIISSKIREKAKKYNEYILESKKAELEKVVKDLEKTAAKRDMAAEEAQSYAKEYGNLMEQQSILQTRINNLQQKEKRIYGYLDRFEEVLKDSLIPVDKTELERIVDDWKNAEGFKVLTGEVFYRVTDGKIVKHRATSTTSNEIYAKKQARRKKNLEITRRKEEMQKRIEAEKKIDEPNSRAIKRILTKLQNERIKEIKRIEMDPDSKNDPKAQKKLMNLKDEKLIYISGKIKYLEDVINKLEFMKPESRKSLFNNLRGNAVTEIDLFFSKSGALITKMNKKMDLRKLGVKTG